MKYHKNILLHALLKYFVSESDFQPITYFFSIARIIVCLLQKFHREYGIERFIVVVCAYIYLSFVFF